jgi:hypothetical protein
MKLDSSAISKIGIMFIGAILGVYIIIEAILSRTSVLGQLYLYVAIAALMLGLFSPRTAMYALIFCTGYIDLFKRLMVLAGNPTNFDVSCALATPPLLCAGSVINLILSYVMGKIELTRSLVISFVFATAILVVAVVAGGGSGGARDVGGLVNLAAYPYLLVLIPAYFPTTADKTKLLKMIYIVFIGVAIYMIKQAYWGLADFEYDYLLTNLSQEVRILVEGENRRCFSTMNGAAIVSIMCSIMCFWSIVNVWKNTIGWRIIRFCLALLFGSAAYLTLSRTGWICGGSALFCYFFFKRWSTTVAVYIVGLSLIVCMVGFSPLIKDMQIVEKFEVELKDYFKTNDSRARQTMTLGSMNGRLSGWVNLMTKENLWSPFGLKFAGTDTSNYKAEDLGDDIIFWSIIKYGFVPVFLGLSGLLVFLFKLHRMVSMLPHNSKEHKIANISLATSVGIIFGGMSNAAQLYVFPVNIYFYLCLSFVYSIYVQRNKYQIKLIKERAQIDDYRFSDVTEAV